jgi:hypothetical protein
MFVSMFHYSPLISGYQNLSLLELFLHGIGGTQTRYLLTNTELLEEERTAFWTVPLQLLYPFAQLLKVSLF